MGPNGDEDDRPPAVDVPPADTGAASALLGDLERICDGSETLMRGIEGATGLLAGEIQVLEVVAAGADHERGVARRTGQPVAAAHETVSRLVERGLLARHRHQDASPAGDPTMVHVSDDGQAVLGQVEAMQLRVTDALLSYLGPTEAAQFRETVQTFSAMLSPGRSALASGASG